MKESQSSDFLYQYIFALVSLVFPFLILFVKGGWSAIVEYLALPFVGAAACLWFIPLAGENARQLIGVSVVPALVLIITALCGARAELCALLLALLLFYGSYRRAAGHFSRVRPLFRPEYILSSLMLISRSLMVTFLLLVLLFTSLWEGMGVSLLTLLLALFALVCLCISVRSGASMILRPKKEAMLRKLVSAEKAKSMSEESVEEGSLSLLYAKISDFMEKSHPYKDPSYCITRLAEDMGANTNYVSRAINLVSGKNFRRYINEYRIREAVEYIKNDPSIRIMDLAGMVGFNSTTSFNMSFQLYMGETAREYAQRVVVERNLRGREL